MGKDNGLGVRGWACIGHRKENHGLNRKVSIIVMLLFIDAQTRPSAGRDKAGSDAGRHFI